MKETTYYLGGTLLCTTVEKVQSQVPLECERKSRQCFALVWRGRNRLMEGKCEQILPG